MSDLQPVRVLQNRNVVGRDFGVVPVVSVVLPESPWPTTPAFRMSLSS